MPNIFKDQKQEKVSHLCFPLLLFDKFSGFHLRKYLRTRISLWTKELERFHCKLTDLSPLLWCLRIVLGNRQYFLIEKGFKTEVDKIWKCVLAIWWHNANDWQIDVTMFSAKSFYLDARFVYSTNGREKD